MPPPTTKPDQATLAQWLAQARARPTDTSTQRQIGGAFYRAGFLHAAAECFGRWYRLAPGDADAALSLGSCVQMLGHLNQAEECYRAALVADPTRADAWSNLGTLFQARKDLAAAHEAYTRSLALNPTSADALAGLAGVLQTQGQADDAFALLLERRASVAANTETALLFAKLSRRRGDAVLAEQVVRERLTSPTLSQADQARLTFALADSLDAQDQTEAAFDAYVRANKLKNVRFDASGHARYVDFVCSVEHVAHPVTAPVRVPAPLFIVGMPRSGTTLIEQMLSCHTRIHAAGERNALPKAVSGLAQEGATYPYPHPWTAITAIQLETAADGYRNELWAAAGDVDFVTDKLPGNFYYLGVLPALFPNARVIHCQRDPVDTGLSLFCNDFAFAALPFSYSLENISHYYRDYRRLMAHWSDVATVPQLDVRYEQMVADPAGQIARILAFLELEFEPNVLSFHDSKRVAFTASNDQVRRPVYTSSVGRSSRYREQLAPLRELVAERDE